MNKVNSLLSDHRVELIVLALGVTLYFGYSAASSAGLMSENARLVSAFDLDESLQLGLIRTALSGHTPLISSIIYGHIYLNLVLWPLYLGQALLPVSDQTIIVSLRLLSTLSAILTVLVTFVLARRYCSRLTAWLAAVFLSVVPREFFSLLMTAHPDTLQMLFVVSGIYFCCRFLEDRSGRWLIWASVCSGLAFSAKWSGGGLLAIVWLLILMDTFSGKEEEGRVFNAGNIVTAFRLEAIALAVVILWVGFTIPPDSYNHFIFFARHYFPASRLPTLEQLLSRTHVAAGLGAGIMMALVIWSFLQSKSRFILLMHRGLVTCAAFAGAFILTSPSALINFRFVAGLIQAVQLSSSHYAASQYSMTEWFKVLSTTSLIGWLFSALALASLIGLAVKVSRSGWSVLFGPMGIIWLWIILYGGLVLFGNRTLFARNLLPIVPLPLLSAAQALVEGVDYLGTRLSGKAPVVMRVVVIAAILFVEVPPGLARAAQYLEAKRKMVATSESVQAGEWLAATYPPSTRVVYDRYSYVPPVFNNLVEAPGSFKQLKLINPTVVIVNDVVKTASVSNVYHLPDEIHKINAEYYKLVEDQEHGFKLVRDFGSVRVYQNND